MNSYTLKWVFISPISSLEKEFDFVKSCLENSLLGREEISEHSF